MSINPVLDYHVKALHLREARAGVLSNNLTNASTPHYKARDFNFADALKSVAPGPQLPLEVTQPGHIELEEPQVNFDLEKIDPTQASLDDNTVDIDKEQAKFLDNTMQHQATLTFIKRHFAGLMTAMQGE